MNLQDNIDELERRLRELHRKMDSCQHTWHEPVQITDTIQEPVYENQPMGSDFFNPVFVGTKNVDKVVWVRRCMKCGFRQKTITTEPIITGERPVFP